jgi:uncharacterized protein
MCIVYNKRCDRNEDKPASVAEGRGRWAFTGPGDGSLCAQEVVVLTYTKEFEDVAACPVVDTDCHITEPADIWVSRMSSTKWGDLVPHVVRSPEGTDSWFVGDVKVANVDSSAMVRTESGGATRVIGSAAERVTSFDVIHPSAFDASERLKVMDSTGVCVEVLFPNLSFFGGDIFRRAPDPEFQLSCVRAYNDWLIDWISPDPSRFIAMACIPYWDVDAAVAEIERSAGLGHRGIIMTGAPQRHGQPLLADRHWDRLWAAASAHEMPVNFHAAAGDISQFSNNDQFRSRGMKATLAQTTTSLFLDNGIQLTDLLTSSILPRFPDLRFVVVESGLGWIPFVLESVDYHFDQVDAYSERPEYEMAPSEYFYRQVYVNYWFEKMTDFYLERVGTANILFETDYPHTTCIAFDEVARLIDRLKSAVEPEVHEAILWRNAAQLYGLDQDQLVRTAARISQK